MSPPQSSTPHSSTPDLSPDVPAKPIISPTTAQPAAQSAGEFAEPAQHSESETQDEAQADTAVQPETAVKVCC